MILHMCSHLRETLFIHSLPYCQLPTLKSFPHGQGGPECARTLAPLNTLLSYYTTAALSTSLGLDRVRAHDAQEGATLQGGTTHQEAINVWLGSQVRAVGVADGATVDDAQGGCGLWAQLVSEQPVCEEQGGSENSEQQAHF